VGLDDLIVAVWDRQLHAASVSAGLRVAPASIGDEHFEEVENSRDSGGQSSRTIIRDDLMA